MRDDSGLYWIWLADKCGAASKDFARLIARFEDPFEIYRLEPEEIEAIDFIGTRLKSALSNRSLESAYSIIKYCKKHDVDIITYGDSRYPTRLRSLEDPPAVLYCLGKLPNLEDRVCIGVVGTRKISAYGMESAYKIAYELASSNVCVVSGMALGGDAVAACAALEARGDTVAVLGFGIDVVYPKEHKKLKKCISHGGAVITEYPPGEPPYGKNFPQRNRIISGLCQGVLVIEGDKISGAMITARCAISQGRDVFALPGKINESNSEGTNSLIRDGARLILSTEDILYHYDFVYGHFINYRGLKHAKSYSDFSVQAVERYGVSTQIRYVPDPKAYSVGAAEDQNKKSKPTIVDQIKQPKETEMASTEENDAEGAIFLQILDGLDPITKRVFELLPIDKSVLPDEFLDSGIGIAEAITALTILEINGLVTSLPGGAYLRK